MVLGGGGGCTSFNTGEPGGLYLLSSLPFFSLTVAEEKVKTMELQLENTEALLREKVCGFDQFLCFQYIQPIQNLKYFYNPIACVICLYNTIQFLLIQKLSDYWLPTGRQE